ncbi:MAG: hypothetical protein ACRC47_08500 [Shewanella sp.]
MRWRDNHPRSGNGLGILFTDGWHELGGCYLYGCYIGDCYIRKCYKRWHDLSVGV